MDNAVGKKIEVYSLEEIPSVQDNMRYFACIGGSKNYECFLDYKLLSRADFMQKYASVLDPCHIPIFEDDEILIRQDAQIPIPGFFIVATKHGYKRISNMDTDLYRKCLYYSSIIRDGLKTSFNISRVFMYYDEHYNKPSSTHFWIMPIYENIIQEYGLRATILSEDIWRYQSIFEFQNEKERIYEANNVMRKVLRRDK